MRKRGSGRSFTAVSIRGDKRYMLALNTYAKATGQMVGDVVRRAVDDQLGDDLKPFLAIFVSTIGRSIDHTDESAAD